MVTFPTQTSLINSPHFTHTTFNDPVPGTPPPPRQAVFQKVTFSRQVSPQKSPHFSHPSTDHLENIFSGDQSEGIPIWSEKQVATISQLPNTSVKSPETQAQAAVPSIAPIGADATEPISAVSMLPPPMSGAFDTDTDFDGPIPPVVKARKLNLLEVRFKDEVGELDLSSSFPKTLSRRSTHYARHPTVGDSIDLSGLTAQVRFYLLYKILLFNC